VISPGIYNVSNGLQYWLFGQFRWPSCNKLADRPHTSLWLAKTYVIPAGMYGSQVWGTVFLQAGKGFYSPLSTLHLHFLKGTLGVKQSTTNWAVLREC
jgi:hypothetical protein